VTTVLFTDIVGSTKRAEELGDSRWRELLAEHDLVVRRQLQLFKGREVKTTGDGFLATFDSPGRAVQCARAIRDGVRRLGLELRVGLHTGECELSGADVAGIAVHIASRIQSLAAPGESLSREPSATSSPARGFGSPTGGATHSRASKANGSSSPSTASQAIGVELVAVSHGRAAGGPADACGPGFYGRSVKTISRPTESRIVPEEIED
jgi:hypothetical protein